MVRFDLEVFVLRVTADSGFFPDRRQKSQFGNNCGMGKGRRDLWKNEYIEIGEIQKEVKGGEYTQKVVG